MEKENWHSSFDPQKFLSRVNLDKLIEHNEAYNENKVAQGSVPCILCSSRQGPGILLNDKSYLCRVCFSEVSVISYPQRYEKLRRKYLTEIESRRIALEEFTKKYGYSKKENPVFIFAWLSLGLFFIRPSLLTVTVVLFLISTVIERLRDRKLEAWNKKKAEWGNNYPEPAQPILRHFHDPEAELTEKDYKILKIFNNWPGYPPFWNYLREVVLSRDGDRCQVTGCPSRVTLHVHHKVPVSKGGEHILDNLVSLCNFHHALEPDEGHERIWGTIKTRYFTLVREHTRSNRSGKGTHHVKPHIRRLELIKIDELEELTKVYGFECPECSSSKLKFTLYSKKNKLRIACNDCNKAWEGRQQLTEETGPRVAELLKVSRNKGQWKARWDMLSLRADSTFSALSAASNKRKTKATITIRTINAEEKPVCPDCGSPMRLISPRPGQKWSKFWGCTKYQSTGCRGKANC